MTLTSQLSETTFFSFLTPMWEVWEETPFLLDLSLYNYKKTGKPKSSKDFSVFSPRSPEITAVS